MVGLFGCSMFNNQTSSDSETDCTKQTQQCDGKGCEKPCCGLHFHFTP